MTTNKEYERKFLATIEDVTSSTELKGFKYFVQDYLSVKDNIRVRAVYESADYSDFIECIKTQKIKIDGGSEELNENISVEEYPVLKSKAECGLTKNRFITYEGYEVDAFLTVTLPSGELLVYSNISNPLMIEVEFSTLEEKLSFTPPSWFGEEVTNDDRFKNANIACNGLPEMFNIL